MDELRGPTIQIVLHVKEGIGFGFLKSPFVVSGSLNGYKLETDPVIPTHAPYFDAELVWEADKRRFRNLRVQNVPVKVEVHTLGTQGHKDKVGYLLLSLLAATPCPHNKYVDPKYTWNKLLGVRPAGKCCQPQLMLSLSIEDRNTTLTPRNELRLFHSNEVAYPTYATPHTMPRSMAMTVSEYIAESKKTVTSSELAPKLLCDEGLIQIGDGKQLFVLSFVIGAAENVDQLIPDVERATKETGDCYISYSVFTHDIMTDRVAATQPRGASSVALFNQRTSLRLRTTLPTLARYFAECPYVIVKLTASEADVGICSMDLRKIIPTDDLNRFLQSFCSAEGALTLQERCYFIPATAATATDVRAFVDVEICLRYVPGRCDTARPQGLTARSATHLERGGGGGGGGAGGARVAGVEGGEDKPTLDCKSGSCTDIDAAVDLAYTNISASNTTRYRNAYGEAPIPTLEKNEIAEMIKKMYQSFALSQEKLLTLQLKPTTSDMQIQCDPEEKEQNKEKEQAKQEEQSCVGSGDSNPMLEREPPTAIPRTESYVPFGDRGYADKDLVKLSIPLAERDAIMQKFVNELEDWKEKQQELYKCQLIRKEEYHLELLAKEWAKKQVELECKLARGIDQCRTLAADLSRASEDFRLRGYRNTEREKKLLDAKKGLEQHYTDKFQELREASQKMEDDMNHHLRVKDMRIEELELKIMALEKQVDGLKNHLQSTEKEAVHRYTGLTRDQTASLIQELRCLEEKLDSAVQAKAFFKEQWGRAVRELHFIKLGNRKQMLTQLKQDRKRLGEMGLDTILDQDEGKSEQEAVDMTRLKDDFYVDILANMPALESHSFISNLGPGGMDEMCNNLRNAPKNPTNDKLNDLIAQRDKLVKEENPDENKLKQLNYEIRNILINNIVN